jgi:hypothetical protein
MAARISKDEMRLLHSLFYMGNHAMMLQFHDQVLRRRGIDPDEFMITMDGWIVRREIKP